MWHGCSSPSVRAYVRMFASPSMFAALVFDEMDVMPHTQPDKLRRHHTIPATARGVHDVFFEGGDGAALLAQAQPELVFTEPSGLETMRGLSYGDAAELMFEFAELEPGGHDVQVAAPDGLDGRAPWLAPSTRTGHWRAGSRG